VRRSRSSERNCERWRFEKVRVSPHKLRRYKVRRYQLDTLGRTYLVRHAGVTLQRVVVGPVGTRTNSSISYSCCEHVLQALMLECFRKIDLRTSQKRRATKILRSVWLETNVTERTDSSIKWRCYHVEAENDRPTTLLHMYMYAYTLAMSATKSARLCKTLDVLWLWAAQQLFLRPLQQTILFFFLIFRPFLALLVRSNCLSSRLLLFFIKLQFLAGGNPQRIHSQTCQSFLYMPREYTRTSSIGR
jgi:hypothetical protein